MGQFLDLVRAPVIGACVVAAAPAQALVIMPAFDLNPTTDPNSLNNTSNPSGEVAAIETAINTIDGLYSNPGTVYVLFNYSSGAFGESNDNETFVPYAQYVSQLSADSAANPTNYVLATALANIAKGNSADYLLGTTAYLRVGLGFTGTGTTPSLTSTAVSGTFDGIISIGNLSPNFTGVGLNSQTTSVVEHELDEVLGGGGTGTTVGQDLTPYIGGDTAIGPTDPYRFQASGSTCATVTGTPSYTISTSAVACYSIDGGVTSLVRMNQSGDGSDYGDFATTSPNIPYIQDAYYPGATNDYSTLSPEFTMLESIGYDAVPEPSGLAVVFGGLAGLGWLRRRGARTG